MLAGWISRRRLDAIEYPKAENRLLKERLGGRRLRFTDAERRRLARRAHALGRKALNELDTLVTPDTLMRWYRTLVARKWTGELEHHVGRGTFANVLRDKASILRPECARLIKEMDQEAARSIAKQGFRIP